MLQTGDVYRKSPFRMFCNFSFKTGHVYHKSPFRMYCNFTSLSKHLREAFPQHMKKINEILLWWELLSFCLQHIRGNQIVKVTTTAELKRDFIYLFYAWFPRRKLLLHLLPPASYSMGPRTRRLTSPASFRRGMQGIVEVGEKLPSLLLTFKGHESLLTNPESA